MTEVLMAPAAPAAERSWTLCAGCRGVTYTKRLRRNQWICPDCGYHGRVPARERLDQLLDPGYLLLPEPVLGPDDPLGFVDRQPYRIRLASARRHTGLTDAVICARGSIEGHALIVAVMDFEFLGGSLGCAVGELVTGAMETALADRLPLLLVTASGGARMQEGVLSLMQMAKTGQALAQLDEAGLLTISLITDPTFGGVAASFATLCDVVVAEPRARMGFAGPRVIEQTIRQELPPGFQTAEFLLEHGLIDAVWPRAMLRKPLSLVLSFAHRPPARTDDRTLTESQPPGPGAAPVAPPIERDAMAVVRRARNIARPTTLDYIGLLMDDFEELHGDRLSGDCPAIVGGIGVLDGRRVVVIGHQKGHFPADLAVRNYGMATPDGYRKAARLMRLAAKLGVAVLTLVDTPGAYPGLAAEEQGQAIAIAENIRLMASLPVPVVTVITGEGGSGGALALAVADRVLIAENAVYSVITPEGCAAILWKDPAAAPLAAAELQLSAPELLRLGIVDAVVAEPPGGAESDYPAAAGLLSEAIIGALDELAGRAGPDLVAERRARYRDYGRVRSAHPAEEVNL